MAFNSAYNALEDSAIESIRNINNIISGEIRELYHESENKAAFLAKNPEIKTYLKNGDYQSLALILQGFYEETGGLENVFISSAEQDTRILADGIKGRSVGTRWNQGEFAENVSRALKGQKYISDNDFSPVTKTGVFLVTEPVIIDGRPVAILGLAVDSGNAFQAFVENVKILDRGYPFITRADGLFIGHPNTDFLFKMNINDFEWGKTIMKSDSDTIVRYPWSDGNKILHFLRDDKYGFMVMTSLYVDDIGARAQFLRLELWLLGLLALIISGVIVIGFVGRKLSPLQEASNCLNEIYLGNYSVRLIHSSRDEIGHLAESMNKMAEGLEYNANVADQIAGGNLTAEIKLSSDHDRLSLAMQGMIEQMSDSLSVVQMTASEVSAGSSELASSSQSLSQGATEQAASLEEITSSMVEIASQSRANADNAEQANRLARDSKMAGESSREKMQEMVQAVSEINNSSREIAKIIKVIDDIAFQTNLLALNAAVEAARAGKHGKGFAVVAEEVRNLAARSAKAAKETAELIDNSVKKVEDGTKIAVQTSESLEQIVVGAAKVADYLAEIAAASNEQALGVEQVNTGLSQVDQVTQSMSANAEETAAASEELSAQSERLMEVLNRFRFKNTDNEFKKTDDIKTSAERKIKPFQNRSSILPKTRPPASISLSDDEFGKY